MFDRFPTHLADFLASIPAHGTKEFSDGSHTSRRLLTPRRTGREEFNRFPLALRLPADGYSRASLNCGRLISSVSRSNVTSTRRPTLASVYGASSRLPAMSAPGASSSSTMMLAYGTAAAKRLSPA